MRYLLDNPGPSYLRLGKAGERCIHAGVPDVAPGRWLTLREGEQYGASWLTTGAVLDTISTLMDVRPGLAGWSLNSMPLWGIQAKAAQPATLTSYSRVITVEDHLIDAGFGSWLLEAASAHPELAAKITIKGLHPKVCGMVGKQTTLNAEGGLTADALCD